MNFSNKIKSWANSHPAKIFVVVVIAPLLVSVFGLESVPNEPKGFSNLKIALQEFATWGILCEWFLFAVPMLACYLWYHGMPESKDVAQEGFRKLLHQGGVQKLFKVAAPICTMVGVVIQHDVKDGLIMFGVFLIYMLIDLRSGKSK
ncbi:MAG: hypothetical protein OXU94_08100 [Gammaproteobacteria bacterium]|nr:hypothetical protein [Gammaproteobacteria bacterium]